MVGKVRRPRARLHEAAVKAARPAPNAKEEKATTAETTTTPSRPAEVTAWSGTGGQDWGLVSSDIFAGTTIDPKALVQKLDVDARSVVSAGAAPEAKPVLSKKEKMKLRRCRWLQKIEAIKAAEEARRAQARRKATAVVGDLHPLMEALPELSELVTGSRPRRKLKSAPRPKAEPADFNRMTPAQKRKLLDDEMARFRELAASPSYRADPLRAIGEQLSKRLRQEDGRL
ncbi:ribosome biogenesis protein SLX9 homolog isoform X1 [Antechinus flavipes]|uniref:ribosome biogenesis protein SLX9 homolog isoform X1 n=2 Tax=Antechinus flavipes TaxID=38775 RepID=UPI00223609C5|nr:ribosome biogenesis protein SLX9 homolog isoform X1 [Antechinus flavipes]XP_051854238.1 ribosome biogenesis protein SLX9 homolog isoform X1 [Antechinus flavipes]